MSEYTFEDVEQGVTESRTREAEVREQWKRDHLWVTFCADTEEIIRKSLGLYKQLRDLDEDFSSVVRKKLIPMESSQYKNLAVRFEKIYRNWLGLAESLRESARMLTNNGYEVEGVEELKTAYNDCPVHGFDVARVNAAIDDVKNGRVLRREEAFNEVRRRIIRSSR